MAPVDAAAQALERTIRKLSWGDIYSAAAALWLRAKCHPDGPPASIYGVPTGGCLAALAVQAVAGVQILDEPEPNCLVVDDLIDSGKTLRPFKERGFRVDALYRKSTSPVNMASDAQCLHGWLQFPWERDHAPTDAIIRVLEYIGEDPNREGLLDTPMRVMKAWKELTVGYQQDPKAILARTFDVAHDELVLVRNVAFTSICEHHMLPFTGVAHVGYLPAAKGPVVGLSKLARLVECFARRLQVQERLTQEVAQAILEYLQPQGVGVVIRAKHSCMSCRGVQKAEADMVTSCMLGLLRKDASARAEFLTLVNQ